LPAFTQAQQPPPTFTITQVAGPIYMIQGDGGNVGVLADPAGVLMIDSMYERSAPSIRAMIKSLPGGDRIRILINTHWHADHTEGNVALGSGAVIIAQENVRSLLAKPQTLMGQQTKALPSSTLPTVTYSDKLALYVGNEPIRLIHYPNCHSNGDTVVFFDRSNVIHMGDMFFNGLFPFIDIANGGNIENWVRQLDKILSGLPDNGISPHSAMAGLGLSKFDEKSQQVVSGSLSWLPLLKSDRHQFAFMTCFTTSSRLEATLKRATVTTKLIPGLRKG
jgi:glyoxylase-like metal-dependent hydrolase (beta-lactamase superfamily II)